ncbi:cytochrome d ubiquinol oxidase subunit II [Oscillochloris sp. ZM17-4]|uniref:cytochrome d ubiquinol oxidase subunit II n=1 Tax=Oscillochloris sp. ZM17-4 TaxID=2866714 RepID=UPI001C730DB9|nr:cytochrome d ubiquinol oxidase subunit II [Oscillochloris sp. ZM17-4]MBX0329322.1 cytochrome d ubiquinol oxidase subunit II [Oscillochloris sp. ZM17-4]
MPLENLVAGVGLLAVIAYAVLGGADFGGGIWDVFASGPRREAQRTAIAGAMGPVWEANHVWLIFVIVILFTAFPTAFAALSVALFIPFHLALLGIILRGTAFVFRAYSPVHGGAGARGWGVIFGVASVMTPLALGMALGAVSAGQLRVSGGEVLPGGASSWLTPLSLAMGALALALCAYLAAVFLSNETAGALREDFRRRALLAGTAVVGLSALALPLLYIAAPHLWGGLLSLRAAPALGIGTIAALLSGWALARRRYRLARISAVAQIICLLAGWGLAQYPYLIFPDVTLSAAAAGPGTLAFVLYSLPIGMALLLPSLWLLFRVFKGEYIR